MLILCQTSIASLLATDNHLIGIFEYLESCERYDPEVVGMTLAKVHLALETAPIGGTLSWVGFYGEYEEFKFYLALL